MHTYAIGFQSPCGSLLAAFCDTLDASCTQTHIHTRLGDERTGFHRGRAYLRWTQHENQQKENTRPLPHDKYIKNTDNKEIMKNLPEEESMNNSSHNQTTYKASFPVGTSFPMATSSRHPTATYCGQPMATSSGHPMATSSGHALATPSGNPVVTSIGHPMATSTGHSVATSTGTPWPPPDGTPWPPPAGTPWPPHPGYLSDHLYGCFY